MEYIHKNLTIILGILPDSMASYDFNDLLKLGLKEVKSSSRILCYHSTILLSKLCLIPDKKKNIIDNHVLEYLFE